MSAKPKSQHVQSVSGNTWDVGEFKLDYKDLSLYQGFLDEANLKEIICSHNTD
ncbi:hypothetical protein [Peribacillus sp. R9-11]|uniref:hypothetical protein n=1 Tax=Peribacillus sp. R9-11 TaxID=3073271 RepID=UPI002868A0D9|nr:hypothetical protein [Peribacillus sp. R9-11]WMX53385.1 hypothetical protein RE409_14840 [Peribacillus sp. R9-11]